MAEKRFTKFEVGKPFPGPVPAAEGAHMELWKDGLNVVIQMPGLQRDELRAFKKGFKRYSYLESSTYPPVAYWIFKFSDPHGPVECNFNSRIVKPEYITAYLDTAEGGIKNAVTFYLLGGETLRAMKLVGLDPEAVKLFHATISKQLSAEYSQSDYDRYLAGLMEYNVHELYLQGKIFIHKK